jgi:hypothetical protein
MPQNTLPAAIQNLLHLADSTVQGLSAHGPWIGLADLPADRFRSVMKKLRDAETKFSEARSAKALAGNRVVVADKALGDWLTKARLVVMLVRGARWSELWIKTGFTNQRTTVPKRLESRIALAHSLVSFFARHPEFGVAFADVTAARGRAIYERAVQSREMLQVMTTECGSIKHERDAAERALREMMRQVVYVLGKNIDGADPRWLDFGLSQRKSQRRRIHRFPCEQKLAAAAIRAVTRHRRELHRIAAA